MTGVKAVTELSFVYLMPLYRLFLQLFLQAAFKRNYRILFVNELYQVQKRLL